MSYFLKSWNWASRHLVKLDVELDAPGVILQIAKGTLPMPRLLMMRPARLTSRPSIPAKSALMAAASDVTVYFVCWKGVAPLLLQSRQLLPADADLVGHRKLIFVLTQMISLNAPRPKPVSANYYSIITE